MTQPGPQEPVRPVQQEGPGEPAQQGQSERPERPDQAAQRQPPGSEATAGPGPGRRELAIAVGLVVLGAAVALLGGGRSAGTTPGVPVAPGADTGSSGPTALALVALAGAGAVLLVRNRARLVLGAVLVGVSAALLVVGVSPVRWNAVLGAVPIALGGLLVLLRARRWPQPRGRYDARPPRSAGTPRDTWDALDRGEDPTA
jgi:hypothetical protein